MESGDSDQFPIRAQSHMIEHASLIIVQDQLPRSWIVRTSGTDYGLDGEIEIVPKDGLVRGDIFKFQIKGHKQAHPRADHIVERVNVSSVNYWLEVPLPVILFVVDVDRRIVYWVDVKAYIRDTLSVVRSNWRNQKTTQVKIPIRNTLPDTLQGIEDVVAAYKERLKSYEMALEQLEEETMVADFWGYHIFIHLFDGDIDAWERYLRYEGSDQKLIDDLPFVIWLKQQLKEDKDLINRIRRLVRDTTPEVFRALEEGFTELNGD